jgi:hypothetical protein
VGQQASNVSRHRDCPQYVPDADKRAAAVACLEFSPEYRVLVCRPCGHVVWPSKLVDHFMGLPYQDAWVFSFKASGAVAEGLARRAAGCSPDQFVFPVAVVPRPAQLLLYTDRLQCQLPLRLSAHVLGKRARGADQIRDHWRQAHGIVLSKQQDGSRVPFRTARAARRSTAAQSVCCQKFFPFRRYSNYFAVD